MGVIKGNFPKNNVVQTFSTDDEMKWLGQVKGWASELNTYQLNAVHMLLINEFDKRKQLED